MRILYTLIGFIFVLLATGNVCFAEVDNGSQKAVLVTGASTGIGRKITEVLAENGYFVYAGARKQKDLDALNAIDNVQSVRLDVTIQQEVDAAVQTVRDGGRGLYGLVNNAGVGSGAPLIEVPESDVRWMFDVNVFGVLKVTQAFAPLIIESKGRISNVGSIAGTTTGPFYGAYCMSKFAIEAYTDVLAAEMARFDVQVSIIEPGNYRSELAKTGRAKTGVMDEAKKNSPYAEDYKSSYEGSADRSQFKDPDEVAAAALHALFADQPKPRYMVVPDKEEAGWTIGAAIVRMVQQNEQQEHAFSREELIEILDQVLGTEGAEAQASE
jgi:NAD(P)-dependent dehydrogenase (short-subunit alcohol dehydrogenase family)